MNMSKEPAKQNKTRYVIIAVVIVAILAGAVAYQSFASSSSSGAGQSQTMMNVSPVMNSTETMSSSQTMMSVSIMSSATSSAMAGGTMPATMPTVALLGAGATFPAPLLQTWTVQFNQMYSGVTISYNPIGSGGGIQQISKKTVDFGASDAPLSNAQLAAAPGLTLFPETLGGVAITYNLVP